MKKGRQKNLHRAAASGRMVLEEGLRILRILVSRNVLTAAAAVAVAAVAAAAVAASTTFYTSASFRSF